MFWFRQIIINKSSSILHYLTNSKPNFLDNLIKYLVLQYHYEIISVLFHPKGTHFVTNRHIAETKSRYKGNE